MDKYKIATGIDANKTYLFKNANAIDSHNETLMAVFLGKDHKTDATKFCDLLNETFLKVAKVRSPEPKFNYSLSLTDKDLMNLPESVAMQLSNDAQIKWRKLNDIKLSSFSIDTYQDPNHE